MAAGLYIHIPFCAKKCGYCDFFSLEGQRRQIPAYLDALVQEAGYCVKRETWEPFDTLFMGGGTPSTLSGLEMKGILGRMGEVLPLGALEEATVEANPGTLTHHKLCDYREAGFNRVSIGVQDFNPRGLKLMDRIHSADQAREAFRLAKKAGFGNLNADMIFGWPGQEPAELLRTLEGMLRLEPTHIAAYCFTPEEGTPLGDAVLEGRMAWLGEDALAEYHETVREVLQAEGFEAYEISNYALPGFECRHNLHYWRQENYLGIGTSAATHRDGVRRVNVRNLREYLSRMAEGLSPVFDEEILEEASRASEEVWLRLRLREGLDREAYRQRWGADVMERFPRLQEAATAHLIDVDGERLRLSEAGVFVSNEVFGLVIGG